MQVGKYTILALRNIHYTKNLNISRIIKTNKPKMRPFLIDTDPGYDDLCACLTALKSDKISVKAISLVAGNTTVDKMQASLIRILQLAKILPVFDDFVKQKKLEKIAPILENYKNDGGIKCYKGASEPIMGSYRKIHRAEWWHGTDGLGDIPHLSPITIPDLELCGKIFQDITSAQGIIELSKTYPEELEIVTLGPMTNLALAYKLDPSLPTRIKKIHVMGGNHLGIGNDSSMAEYNFIADPEAAYICLEAFNCLGNDFSIFSWEACMINRYHQDIMKFEDLQKTLNPEFKRFYETLLKNKITSNAHFLTHSVNPDYDGSFYGVVCDAQAVTAAIDPEIIEKSESYSASVELAGVRSRGALIIDRNMGREPEPFDNFKGQDWDRESFGRKRINIIHKIDVAKSYEQFKKSFT